MKIVSWNINSVRFRMVNVARFLAEVKPDILCLQETKVEDGLFPAADFKALGYKHIYLSGQKMHHGVAIISRHELGEVDRQDWQANGEARHIGVTLPNGWRLDNVYVPAGGDVPDRDTNPKFGQKLDFLARMTDWSTRIAQPTLLVGDFNIAPFESDVWGHKQLLDVVSHTPIEVETLARLRGAHGWIDIGRKFVAEPARLYTWWSYRAKDWRASDRGRRLDHMWASPAFAETAQSHQIFESYRDGEKPSDHIPIMTEFAL
jgi:exodeoxyribonuclease III